MKPITPWVLIVGFLWSTASYAAENPVDNSALPSMKVSVSHAPDFYNLDGHVEAVNQSTLSAQTSGTIEKLYYDVDDYVEKGSVIARIKSKNQQAGVQQARAGQAEASASYAEAKARLAEAEAAFKRISDIYARRLVPRADYDNAEAGLKAAQAQVHAAEARTVAAQAQATQAGEQLGYTTVVAPYSGIVTKRHVQLGEAVNPGAPIMSGISLDQLRVVVEVPQRMINAVRKEQKAFVFQDGTNTSIPVKNLTFFPYADPTTNAFKVWIGLEEGVKQLFPGMFVKVAFITGTQADVLTVPESAVAIRSEVIGVYVLDAQGKPSLRQIRLGRKLNDKDVMVLAGLDAGETIALDPVQAAIYLKQAHTPTAEGKAHE